MRADVAGPADDQYVPHGNIISLEVRFPRGGLMQRGGRGAGRQEFVLLQPYVIFNTVAGCVSLHRFE
jgi:hypothetical protein